MIDREDGAPTTPGRSEESAQSTVWLNGAFTTFAEARISAFDAGFQHGVGLFETIGASGGTPRMLEAHLDRLATSARELGLSSRLRVDPLADAVESTLARSGLGEARIRVTVSGGDLNMLSRTGAKPGDPTILIAVQPATPYPAALFERGARVRIADSRLNPLDAFEAHKTLHYWPRLAALQEALSHRCDEALWLSVTNHLCGGSVSSLVVMRDGKVLAPIARGEEPSGGLRSPVLPGVTRAAVLRWAEEDGLEVERRMLSIEDLLKADEACLTNSGWGVLPLVAVEAAEIGGGHPGERTLGWRARWLRGDD
jgi:branched-subunit amino acid aminotransferase/4-amino-4-deoxychorismate lyase